ncbi:hypothetical protein C1646_778015 [Rhizophagus diaphanus]|nr:hypothetical protein C1646_778015 [Rhizophagus diaphanus] [Rhizophagus sp. MUCL 43196]
MSFMSSNLCYPSDVIISDKIAKYFDLSRHFKRFETNGTVPGRYYEEEREVGMLEIKGVKPASQHVE